MNQSARRRIPSHKAFYGEEVKRIRLINLGSRLAQVVTGVRRSGKSTLCLNVLRDSGKRFGYVNFDDERLANLTGADLDDVLAAAYKVYGQFTHLFLDEPQNMTLSIRQK